MKLHVVQLQSIELHEISASKQEAPEENDFSPTMAFESNLLDCNENTATCDFKIRIEIFTEQHAFQAELCMRGDYRSAQPLDRSQWQAFAELQNVFLVWPYVRELLTSITTRMDLPPLVLPLLEIPEGHIEDEET